MKIFNTFRQDIVRKMPILVVTAILLSGFFVAGEVMAAATVTPVGNGTNISIDMSSAGVSPSWKLLGGLGFSAENGDIAIGTHTISLPSGWEFDTSSDITVFGFNDIEFGNTLITPSQNSFSFEVTGKSTFSSSIMFSGIKVRPTGTVSGTTGSMTYSGAGIVGVDGSTNFGTLSTVAGTVTQVAFTTQPSASTIYGSNFAQQPVVITQDQFGNSSTNGLGSNKDVSLSLTSGSGILTGIATVDIGTSVGNGTASFSGLTVDMVGASKQLTATAIGLTPATSELFEITTKTLTAAPTISNKIYDGDTTATVTNLTLSGIVGDDEVSPSTTNPSATFADPNVADGITVTVTDPVTLIGADAGNYTLSGLITGIANITAKEITVTPDSGQTKIYGETDPILTYTNTALVEGDDFTGLLERDTGEDADSYTFSLGTLDLGSNYSLILDTSDPFVITARPLTVIATGVDKIYDRTTDTTVVLSSSDKIEGDDLNFNYTGATFVDKNVGEGKTVNVAGISLSGSDSSNYGLQNTTAVANADINKKSITLTINVNDKTYDGDTGATYSASPRVLVGVIAGDAVIAEDTGSKSFVDKNVGVDKTVTATGITLSGADKDNYDFDGTGLGVATINARPITITATTETKTYDRTTSSTENPVVTNSGELTTGPIMDGDVANFTQAFDSASVGVRTLTPSGTVNDGNGGNNYNYTFVTENGGITAKNITVDVIISNKVYDGATTATITSLTSDGVIEGDEVTFSGGTATFADAEIGNDKEVNVVGITGGGADIANYSYSSSVTAAGNILPIPSVVYVDDNWTGTTEWTDPDEGGSANYFGYDAFATIQEGIDAVSAGGTINVAAGLYTEDLTISKQVDLVGADKSTTKIKGVANVVIASWPLAVPNIDIQADGVEVHGFTIEGPDYESGKYVSGVVITGNNIEIYENNFITTKADTTDELGQAITTYSKTAISTADISGLNIHDNTFTGSGLVGTEAIYINPHVGSGTVTINANEFSGSIFVGITVESGNINITGNDIDSTVVGKGLYGVRFMDTSYAANYSGIVVSGNTIQNFQKGIRVGNGGDGTSVLTASISSNTITGNDTGIWARKGSVLTVDDNNLAGNTVGIQNDITTDVNAIHNWWGTAVESTIDGNVSDHVNYNPYWVNSAMTILSDTSIDTVYVDDSYSDGSAGAHIFGYDAFATIQEGVDAVDEGGTVNVAAGEYVEQVTIDESLSLVGAGEGITTIKAPVSGRSTIVNNGITWDYAVAANGASMIDVSITGFTIDANIQGGDSSKNFAGVFFNNVGDGINDGLYSCSINNFGSYGPVWSSTYNTWMGNYGVVVYGDSTLDIDDNTLDDYTVSGISARGVDVDVAVTSNDLDGTDSGYVGIFLREGTATISGNNIYNHAGASENIGIYLYDAGASVNISENTIEDNQIGLFLAETNGVTIDSNTFTDSVYRSIVIQQDSDNNIVKGNTITMTGEDTDAGIVIASDSGNNIIGGDDSEDGNSITLPTSATGSGTLYTIWLSGADTGNVTVKNNSITGGTRAVQFDGGPGHSGINTVSYNTISNPSFGGIMSSSFGDFVIVGNTITNGVRPIEFQQSGNGTITITDNIIDGTVNDFINLGSVGAVNPIQNNSFLNMGTHKLHNRTALDIDATENWWGSNQKTDIEDKVQNSGGGSIDFDPWYLELEMNNLSSSDTTGPTVVLSDDIDRTVVKDADTVIITAVFSDTNGLDTRVNPTITITNGGVTDEAMIAGENVNTWTYSWDVPSGDASASVSVSAKDIIGNNVSGTTGSTSFVIDNTDPVVTVTSPDGGEYWAGSSTQDITWTNTETNKGTVVIDYTTNGTDWVSIATGETDDGTYSWTVPAIDSTSVKVRVTATDLAEQTGNDSSDSDFVIDNTDPVVTVTSPDGGEYWAGSSTQDITWTNTETNKGTVVIDYTTNGTDWVSIATGETDDGTYSWTVPAIDSTSVKVRVTATDLAEQTGNDSSDSDFVIDNTVPTVISHTPVSDAIGIDAFANITVVFDEDVTVEAADVTLLPSGGSAVTLSEDNLSFDSATNTLTINPTDALANNTKYNIALSGITDLSGNVLADVNWDFTTATSYEISLADGWNLISLPVTPTNWTSVPGVLNSVSDEIESVWTYNAVTGLWYSYTPTGEDINAINSMEAGKGYWAKMDGTGTLTGSGTLYEQLIPSGDAPSSNLPQVKLGAGWNMIGYYQLPGQTTSPVADALSVLGASGGKWDTNHLMSFANGTLDPETTITTMTPGKGYWIFMNEPDVYYTFGTETK